MQVLGVALSDVCPLTLFASAPTFFVNLLGIANAMT
jgi:hypothetical protein